MPWPNTQPLSGGTHRGRRAPPGGRRVLPPLAEAGSPWPHLDRGPAQEPPREHLPCWHHHQGGQDGVDAPWAPGGWTLLDLAERGPGGALAAHVLGAIQVPGAPSTWAQTRRHEGWRPVFSRFCRQQPAARVGQGRAPLKAAGQGAACPARSVVATTLGGPGLGLHPVLCLHAHMATLKSSQKQQCPASCTSAVSGLGCGAPGLTCNGLSPGTEEPRVNQEGAGLADLE